MHTEIEDPEVVHAFVVFCLATANDNNVNTVRGACNQTTSNIDASCVALPKQPHLVSYDDGRMAGALTGMLATVGARRRLKARPSHRDCRNRCVYAQCRPNGKFLSANAKYAAFYCHMAILFLFFVFTCIKHPHV